MWVKICGITNREDALAAERAGADAVGFIFVSSSRRSVTRQQVAEILPALPSTIETVGVVAGENPDFLRGLLRVCPLKTLQFHGEESPEEVLQFKGQAKLIKAIRVKDPESVNQIPFYQGVDAVLLDTHRDGKLGGTGETFDWGVVRQAQSFGIPLIIGGGLSPDNVAGLIKEVKPYGVDVATGVEAAPGKKDHELVRQFIRNARQAEAR